MKNIFDEIKINKLRAKNRLVRSATWEGLAYIDGSINKEIYEIYDELARGGVGTIITGFTSVSSDDFYQGKNQETAEKILKQIQNWRKYSKST